MPPRRQRRRMHSGRHWWRAPPRHEGAPRIDAAPPRLACACLAGTAGGVADSMRIESWRGDVEALHGDTPDSRTALDRDREKDPGHACGPNVVLIRVRRLCDAGSARDSSAVTMRSK